MDFWPKNAEDFLGTKFSNRQLEQFGFFEKLLIEWNQKINLTSISSPQEIHIKHFLDSLTCLFFIKNVERSLSLVDVGTGAGFPGIPLKIYLPDMHLTLVESVKKKADFCLQAINTLHLENVRVCNTRAEELGQNPVERQSYDWAVARAVSDLPVLVEYLLPLVKIGGKALVMKGKNVDAEIQKSGKAIHSLGGKLGNCMNFDLLEGFGNRTLILINKVASTPAQYPRRSGIPVKKPLL